MEREPTLARLLRLLLEKEGRDIFVAWCVNESRCLPTKGTWSTALVDSATWKSSRVSSESKRSTSEAFTMNGLSVGSRRVWLIVTAECMVWLLSCDKNRNVKKWEEAAAKWVRNRGQRNSVWTTSLLNTKRASEESRFEHRFGDFCLKLKKGHCRESDIVNESRLNSFPKKPSVVEILSIPNNLIKLTHRWHFKRSSFYVQESA